MVIKYTLTFFSFLKALINNLYPIIPYLRPHPQFQFSSHWSYMRNGFYISIGISTTTTKISAFDLMELTCIRENFLILGGF